MPYITVDQMRDRLPNRGDGVSDDLIEEAIDAAIQQVVIVTADPTGEQALGRLAVSKYALADLLETIFPRDARSFLGREEDSDANTLRIAGDRALAAFQRIKELENPPVPVLPVVTVETHDWNPGASGSARERGY